MRRIVLAATGMVAALLAVVGCAGHPANHHPAPITACDHGIATGCPGSSGASGDVGSLGIGRSGSGASDNAPADYRQVPGRDASPSWTHPTVEQCRNAFTRHAALLDGCGLRDGRVSPVCPGDSIVLGCLGSNAADTIVARAVPLPTGDQASRSVWCQIWQTSDILATGCSLTGDQVHATGTGQPGLNAVRHITPTPDHWQVVKACDYRYWGPCSHSTDSGSLSIGVGGSGGSAGVTR